MGDIISGIINYVFVFHDSILPGKNSRLRLKNYFLAPIISEKVLLRLTKYCHAILPG